MKILQLAPYAFFENEPGFVKNTSGLAFAVTDVCTSLANEGHEIYLLTQSGFTKGTDRDGIHLCRKTWFDVVGAMKFRHLKNGMRAIQGMKAPLSYKCRVVLYYMTQGYAEKIIRQVQPDMVHIHAIGLYTFPFMQACIAQKIPFLSTNHGLGDFPDNKLNLSELDKEFTYEPLFFQLSDRKGLPVTTVSTGLRNRALETFSMKGDSLYVVLNGCDMKSGTATSEECDALRRKYGIRESDRVFVCVGSISSRKNQIQVVRAFDLMDSETKKNTKLLLIGDGPSNQEVADEIEKRQLGESIKMCGFVDRARLDAYYQIAHIHITASKNEGFGLPIIEAFSFGLPTVAFADIDAIPDLYTPNCMVLAKNRQDVSLKNVMQTAIDMHWDKDGIRAHSQKFTNAEMAKAYASLLEKYRECLTDTTQQDLLNLL